MRKFGTVIINDKPYGLYDIKGKEHGGWNGEPKTWWVYYADELPDGMIPPVDSESWKPYCKSINRLCWEIQIKERNYTKVKWDNLDFRSNVSCKMFCNNRLVYEFGSHDMAFSIGKAQYLMVMLCEHPYNFLNPEENRGRKIWWYGLPATVSPRREEGWHISIIPDYTAGIDKETWWKEFKVRRSNLNEKKDPNNDIDIWEDDDDEMRDSINWGDALSDGRIDWFRK